MIRVTRVVDEGADELGTLVLRPVKEAAA
jgi:hypothetical protein